MLMQGLTQKTARRLSIICAEEAGRNGARLDAAGAGGKNPVEEDPKRKNPYTKWMDARNFCHKKRNSFGKYCIYDLKPHFEKCSQLVILPETNRAPENEWLGDDPFLLWPSAYFQAMLVLGRNFSNHCSRLPFFFGTA